MIFYFVSYDIFHQWKKRQRITEFEANDQKVDIEEMEYRLQLMNTSQYIKQVIHKKKDKRRVQKKNFSASYMFLYIGRYKTLHISCQYKPHA